MAINWTTIKNDVALAMDAALVAAQGASMAKFPVSAISIAATYTWNGSDTVTTLDTSEVVIAAPGNPPPGGTTPKTPPSFIRLDSDGNWFKVIGIVLDTSIQVEDTYSVGSFPSGVTPSSKSSVPIPAPPESGSFVNNLAGPITNAVVDGIENALDQAVISDVASDSGNTVGPGVID